MDGIDTEALATFFPGMRGQVELGEAVQFCVQFAEAQAPMDEIRAALVIEKKEWSEEQIDCVLAFGAEEIEIARANKRARMRLDIMRAAENQQLKPAQANMLKEWAYQHLGWSREPIDEETKKALRQAEKEQARNERH